MTDPSRDEERALSRDELELVSAARQPGLREMGARDLADLVSRLRERRDRARGLAERQRREMRGKSAPSGAAPAADDTGTRSKEHFLGAALARAMEERDRRRGGGLPAEEGSAADQRDLAETALAMRRAGEQDAPRHPENTAEPDEGMQPIPQAEPEPPVQQEAYPEIVHKSRTPRG